MRRLTPLLLLASACDGCRPEDELPAIVVPIDATASLVYVGDAVGAGPLTVPAFATNLAGGVVPSAAVTVTGDGVTVVGQPTPDGTGWATATLDGEVGRGSVRAELAGASAVGSSWIVSGDPPAWAGPAAVGGPAVAVAVAGGGYVWSEGGSVWWVDEAGGAPVRVLNLAVPVRGVRAFQLDGDGVPDLLVWSDVEVVVLRGRSAGGLTWVAGWAAASGSVVGVDAQDLDGDATLDLAVAVAVDSSTTRVAWLVGAAGGWTYVDYLEVPWVAWGVSGEDLDADGDGEITLLAEGGLLRRFGHFDDQWVSLADGEYDLGLGEGASLLPSVDLDGDGSDDFAVIGPDAGGQGWQGYVVSPPTRTIYRLFAGAKVEAPPTALWADVADLDGDGLRDLILGTESDVRRGRWVPEQGNFAVDPLGVAAGAPVAAGDLDGDGVADLVVGGAPVRAHLGEEGGAGWRTRDAGEESLGLRIASRPVVRDLDDDGIDDFASLTAASTGLRLEVYLGTGATSFAEALDFLDDVGFGAGAEPVGLVGCGRDLYALVKEGEHTLLWWFVIDARLGLGAPAWGIEVEGSALGCVPGIAVVGADDGTVTAWSEDDGAVATAQAPADGPVYGLAAFDPDGDGVLDEVATCSDPGCQVLGADVDGDGTREVVEWRADGVYVDRTTLSLPAPDGVALSAGDTDGDGVDDLLAQADGAVYVFRVGAGWIAPPVVRHVAAPITGPAFVTDDGQGGRALLLWGVDPDPDDDVEEGGDLLRVPAP